MAELYRTVLGRTTATSEIENWQVVLRNGAQRHDVAIGFLYSTEHLTEVVDGYYQRLLHRSIDLEGTRSWVTAIQNGARDEHIIASLIASDEYRSRD